MATSMITIPDVQMDGTGKLAPAPEKLKKQGWTWGLFLIMERQQIFINCKDTNMLSIHGHKSLFSDEMGHSIHACILDHGIGFLILSTTDILS